MKRYMTHIELNHPNYEKFCELSAQELINAQTEAIEAAEKYAQIANESNCFDRPLFNVFRITIYEKTLEFTEKGINIRIKFFCTAIYNCLNLSYFHLIHHLVKMRICKMNNICIIFMKSKFFKYAL